MTNEALYIKVHRPILGPPRPRVISITRHQRQAIRIAAYDLTSHGAPTLSGDFSPASKAQQGHFQIGETQSRNYQ
jgi:hypothetical protein